LKFEVDMIYNLLLLCELKFGIRDEFQKMNE